MRHVGESGLSNLRIRHLQLVEALVDFGALPQAAKASSVHRLAPVPARVIVVCMVVLSVKVTVDAQ